MVETIDIKHFFRRIYNRIVTLASHPHALFYLLLLSFLEACVSPLTPMLVLLPMCLAAPHKMWRYILYAALAAVLGSIVGYCVGSFLMQLATPLIMHIGYWSSFLKVRHWFHQWGIWALLPTSFLPLPYELFTIGAGALGVPLLPFVVMTLVVRVIHFSVLPVAAIWGTNYGRKRWLFSSNLPRR